MFGRSDDGQPVEPPAAGAGLEADPVGPPDPATAAPGVPSVSAPEPTVIAPSSAPTISPAHLNVPAPSVDTTAAASSPASPPAIPDDLIAIKQGALQDLSPLIGHLDQTPEERFRTTMMLIQATDDHTKLKEAYDTAKQITDEKARAQALLDVVNEINYFTQQKKPSS